MGDYAERNPWTGRVEGKSHTGASLDRECFNRFLGGWYRAKRGNPRPSSEVHSQLWALMRDGFDAYEPDGDPIAAYDRYLTHLGKNRQEPYDFSHGSLTPSRTEERMLEHEARMRREEEDRQARGAKSQANRSKR